jgi:hypothetical protein
MQVALTSCRGQDDGQVRAVKESEAASATHGLSNTEGRTSKDTKPRESQMTRGTHGLSGVKVRSSQNARRK